MSGMLTRFRIEALHGFRTIDIPIRDNILILVRENGTGKSTVANLLYFFLTCQWNRMLEYEFKSISAVMDGEEILVTRHELTGAQELLHVDHGMIAPSIESHLLLTKLSQQLEQLFSDSARLLVMRLNINEKIRDNELDQMRLVSQKIKDSVTAQVLYLPTSRRIEQDLQSIFPELEVNSRPFRELFAKKSRRSSEGGGMSSWLNSAWRTWN